MPVSDEQGSARTEERRGKFSSCSSPGVVIVVIVGVVVAEIISRGSFAARLP